MKRLFRLLVVAAVIGVGAWALHGSRTQSRSAESTDTAGRSPAATPVMTTPVRAMQFERILVIAGNVEARNYALVSPRVPGTLDAVFVDEGDKVRAGKTKLFQTDAVKLQKAVAIARQQYAVARCTVLEKETGLERVEADARKAERDFERAKELLATDVIARSSYDADESRHLQAEATVKHARVLISLAKEQKKQAQLNLEIAEKDLRDSLVLAPIDGVVCVRHKEPGEMGIVGQPVLGIQDPSCLEVSGHVPEEYYEQVIPGQTRLRIRIGSLKLPARPVAYKSPTVTEDLRTFEIKSTIEKPPAGVAPGRIAHMELILEQRQGLGVPRSALQRRGSGRVVFTLQDGVAKRLAVRPGLETQGWIEILPREGKGPLPVRADVPIITQGQEFVNDNTAVRLVTEAE